jgi:hypothetical protein
MRPSSNFEVLSSHVRLRFSAAVILPGVALAAICGVIAVRMEPPAPSVASRCASIVAFLLMVKLVAWVVRAGRSFHREERLLTFVMFSAIVMSWVGAQQGIFDVAFNHEVHVQKRALVVSGRDLSREILAFLEGRRRLAPPRPRPATWDEDVAAWARYDDETAVTYDRRFRARVRAAHDLLALRNMHDRDLDTFYERPANDFQVGIVARKLSGLTDKLAREDAQPTGVAP